MDVLQEFKNFALPASGMHRKPVFTLQFFHRALQVVNLMDKVNRKKKEKKETLSGASLSVWWEQWQELY